MYTTAREFAQAIAESTKTGDGQKTTDLCQELMLFLLTDAPFPQIEAERIMVNLRGALRFSLMNEVGNAFIRTGRGNFTVYRQFAQAAIEQGKDDSKQYDLALLILNDLEQKTGASADPRARKENAEARGLLGRLYKQLFINASKKGSPQAADFLKKAIPFYYDVYRSNNGLDKEKYLWQGVNTLALLSRAQKEALNLDDPALPGTRMLAEEIIAMVDQKEVDGTAVAWDYATAAEACIALSAWPDAQLWMTKYVEHSAIDRFALSGTIRQFDEVYGLDSVPEAVGVMTLLKQHYEAKSPAPVVDNFQKTDNTTGFESVFGDDRYQTLEWYEKGLSRCHVIARIGEQASKGSGTGFLLKGSVLSEKLTDDFVLVTNAHVITNNEAVLQNGMTKTLHPDEACVVFEKVDLKEVFKLKEVYWTSDPEKLDTTVALFREEDQQRINDIGRKEEPFPLIRNLPLEGDRTQRVYIIGHPGGGTLSLSLQDNELKGYEGPYLRYRTPTEKGSSGSPVFNKEWKLMGIHHKSLDALKVNEGVLFTDIKSAIKNAGK